MRKIQNIPKGSLNDEVFLHVSNTILAESYIPIFRSRNDNASIRRLCDENIKKSESLLRKAIDEYGKSSEEHHTVFEICQFCTKFMEMLISIEAFRATIPNYIRSFRRVTLPKRPIFVTFSELDPGFPLVPLTDYPLSKYIACGIFEEILEEFIHYYSKRRIIQQNIAHHYTSCDALLGMIDSNSVWLTEIYKLNNMDEFGKSANELRPYVERNFQYFPKGKFVGRLIDHITNISTDILARDVFVFSMTRDDESSSQWINYGKNGDGVCIRFDLDLCSTSENGAYAFDIKYRFSPESIDKLFIDYIIFEAMHASQLALQEIDLDYIFENIKNITSVLWSLFLSSYKNTSFINENEVRLCRIAPSHSLVKSRNGMYGPTRYIDHTFKTQDGSCYLPIVEVKFGNKVSSDTQDRVVSRLANAGYGHVKFTRSTTQLR